MIDSIIVFLGVSLATMAGFFGVVGTIAYNLGTPIDVILSACFFVGIVAGIVAGWCEFIGNI